MEIRPYAETDAAATLGVFLTAVKETASAHYSAEQIAAWARPDERDLREWNSARKSRNTFVATDASELRTHASITARPFFEKYGFVVVAEQRSVTLGVAMTNYRMMLPL